MAFMLSLSDQFNSMSMKERDGRLKLAKRESSRTVRQLERDRVELERRELQLVLKFNVDEAIETSSCSRGYSKGQNGCQANGAF